MKCSPKLEFCSPYDLHKLELPGNMFYTLTGNGFRKKRSDAYLFQVQLSLAIMELRYCDFIVFRNSPLATRRPLNSLDLHDTGA